MHHQNLARGQEGELRIGYQVAARLGAWSIGQREDAMVGSVWLGRADVRDIDPFWLDHGGDAFDLWLVVGPRFWRWRNVRVRVASDRKSAHFEGHGSPEVL